MRPREDGNDKPTTFQGVFFSRQIFVHPCKFVLYLAQKVKVCAQ
jgi:hypothetical protein